MFLRSIETARDAAGAFRPDPAKAAATCGFAAADCWGGLMKTLTPCTDSLWDEVTELLREQN